jgi:hypothetical protein
VKENAGAEAKLLEGKGLIRREKLEEMISISRSHFGQLNGQIVFRSKALKNHDVRQVRKLHFFRDARRFDMNFKFVVTSSCELDGLSFQLKATFH